MRLQDKIAINNMRLEGYSSSVIAAKLGLPASTVRSHIHRHPNIPGARACKNCGRPLMQPKGRREKKFCSDTCRMAWWNSHQTEVSRKAYYSLAEIKNVRKGESVGKGYISGKYGAIPMLNIDFANIVANM